MTEHHHTNHNHPDKTPLPGTFTAAYADPPWSVAQIGEQGAIKRCDLMTNRRILQMGAAVRELAAENSFCFLSVATATVPLGIQVLEAGGFASPTPTGQIEPAQTLVVVVILSALAIC